MDNQIIDEDLAIKAVIEAAALDYSITDSKNPYSWKREGYTKTNRGSVSRAKNCDYKSWVEARTPPAGYLCFRCKLPGHLIQHCTTNGDPNYDFKRMKPATGMPKSMSKGKVAVLQPNEAEFEKMVDCLPTKHVVDIPRELHCPLCKRVMQDAALTGKCCFKSYCDECIRDYTISRNVCACGAPSKVDDLIPNVTVRSTIARYLSLSNDSSGSPNEIQSTTNNAKPKAHSSKSSNKDTINAKSEEKIEAKTTNMPETITESVKEPSVGKKLKKRKLPQAINAGMQSVNCMMPYQPIDYYTYMSNYGVGNYDVAYCGMPLQNYQIPPNCYMMPAVSQSELSKDWIANNNGNGTTKFRALSDQLYCTPGTSQAYEKASSKSDA